MGRVLLILFAAAVLGGCIQRSIRIDSEPRGALVYLNDVEVGRTPTSVPFTWYGVYDVRLEKPGYQTLNTSQEAKAPWFDNPGPDLVTEMLPWRTNIQLEWYFNMTAQQPVDEALTVDRARQMRALLHEEMPETHVDSPETAPAEAAEPTRTDPDETVEPTDSPQ